MAAEPGSVVGMKDVYQEYEMWCVGQGIRKPLTAQQLSARLAEQGIKKTLDAVTRRSQLTGWVLAGANGGSGLFS